VSCKEEDSGDHGADGTVMRFSSFADIGPYPRKIASLDTAATESPTARNRMQIIRKDPDREVVHALRLDSPHAISSVCSVYFILDRLLFCCLYGF
jgi:hypothetical protein